MLAVIPLPLPPIDQSRERASTLLFDLASQPLLCRYPHRTVGSCTNQPGTQEDESSIIATAHNPSSSFLQHHFECTHILHKFQRGYMTDSFSRRSTQCGTKICRLLAFPSHHRVATYGICTYRSGNHALDSVSAIQNSPRPWSRQRAHYSLGLDGVFVSLADCHVSDSTSSDYLNDDLAPMLCSESTNQLDGISQHVGTCGTPPQETFS